MFTDLAIILVNWNLKDDTIECIDSLLNSGAAHSQIIVVDNGSTDGSVSAINNHYQESIVIIELKENLGYAAGVNRGIEFALNQKYKWILLLNNDTIVAADFIDAMYSGTQQADRCAILSPLIFYHQNPSIIWSIGDKFIDHTLLTIHRLNNRKFKGNLPPVIPIDIANGCAMMVNREVFERIGMFDSKLFMYGEEVDFCWRATQAGFKFCCFTPARLWHKISLSSNKDKPHARYLRIRNQVIFYRRYTTAWQRPFYKVFTFLRLIWMIVKDAFKAHFQLIPPSIRGWRYGWFSNLETIR